MTGLASQGSTTRVTLPSRPLFFAGSFTPFSWSVGVDGRWGRARFPKPRQRKAHRYWKCVLAISTGVREKGQPLGWPFPLTPFFLLVPLLPFPDRWGWMVGGGARAFRNPDSAKRIVLWIRVPTRTLCWCQAGHPVKGVTSHVYVFVYNILGSHRLSLVRRVTSWWNHD